MRKILVKASSPYEIIVGNGLLENCGTMVRSVCQPQTVVLVTDDIVDELYSAKVIKSLAASGFAVRKFVFPNGEASKSFPTLNRLYTMLADYEITRTDCIIALGGGVVGDLAGYAAATYLRGVDFIQIPTTLLAQVDSSVGGKTAIDIPAGKNLVGAFKQPKIVICDTDALSTLKKETFSDGMGEVIKYAMVRSKDLFMKIMTTSAKKDIENIICECINIKRQIVEKDEFDKGERMLLNFGHTFGHAIEKAQNYTGMSHGHAVGVGMCIITKFAEEIGYCKAGTLTALKKCLKKYGLPTTVDLNMDTLIDLTLNDKKRTANSIYLVLCSEIGCAEAKKFPVNAMMKNK